MWSGKVLGKTLIFAAVLMVLVEAGLRALGFGAPLLYRASAAGYEPVPGQSIDRLGKRTHINQLGLRGPEVAQEPAAGVSRILCLGDSVMNGGAQMNDEDTLPAQLQVALQAAGHRAEVLNASAGGWALSNAAAWLEAHGTMGAGLIVLEVNDKDLDQPFADATTLQLPPFPTRRPVLALGEVVQRYVLPRLGLTGPARDPGSTNRAFNAMHAPSARAAVGAIAGLARANRAGLLIVFWDSRDRATAPRVAAAQDMFQLAERLGVPVVRPALAGRTNATSLYRDNIHPSVSGNRAVAQFLAGPVGAMLQKDSAAAAGALAGK